MCDTNLKTSKTYAKQENKYLHIPVYTEKRYLKLHISKTSINHFTGSVCNA